MNYLDENPIAEVHRIRAELLKEYGGISGLHKHMDEERPRLEKEGWHFLTDEEMDVLRQRNEASPCN